jgi:hypothetical protein
MSLRIPIFNLGSPKVFTFSANAGKSKHTAPAIAADFCKKLLRFILNRNMEWIFAIKVNKIIEKNGEDIGEI